jgi:hypothetical protein
MQIESVQLPNPLNLQVCGLASIPYDLLVYLRSQLKHVDMREHRRIQNRSMQYPLL